MAIDNNLREIREKEGVSIAELSRTSEVSDKTIRKIETRKLNKAKKITKSKIIKGLNKFTEKSYLFEEIFPKG